MTETLFVYGTLMPNCPNGYVLENIIGKFTPAIVRGNLKNAGWSASMGYPGIHLDEEGDIVHGFLFSSNNLCNHWDYLDEFEGKEFERQVITIETYDEILVDTYIYVLKAEEDIIEE